MFPATNIRDWRLHDVVDEDGRKVGKLEAVYVDTATDLPAFASITTGSLRRRLVFAPLEGATVAPDHIRIKFSKKMVKDAPAIGTDGELLAEEERPLFEHYGLEFETGSAGERRLARR